MNDLETYTLHDFHKIIEDCCQYDSDGNFMLPIYQGEPKRYVDILVLKKLLNNLNEIVGRITVLPNLAHDQNLGTTVNSLQKEIWKIQELLEQKDGKQQSK